MELEKIAEEKPRDVFQYIVIVLLALTTLWGATVSFLESQASVQEDEAARAAETYAIQSMGELIRANQQLGYDMDVLGRWRQNNARRDQENTLARAYRLQGDEAAAKQAEEQAARWEQVNLRLAQLTPILSDTAYAADYGLYYEGASRLSYLYTEKQLLAFAQTEALGRKGDGYVTIITTLAVALFLFGLSLTIPGWIRFVFVVVGVFIVVLSFLWAMFIFFQPVPDMSEEAMQSYVEGVIQSNATTWASEEKVEEERKQAAIIAFSKAIKINPEYGRAYDQRAYLREGGLEAITDYLAAIRYGKDDVFAHGNLGWEYYLAGDYQNSLDETLTAVHMDPQECTYRFNLGLIYLAMGRGEEADAAYGDALQCAAASRADWRDWYLQRAALVDLQDLLKKQPGNEAVRKWVIRVKEAIATVALYGDINPRETQARLGGIIFSPDVDENDQPVEPTTQFVEGTDEVYATFSFEGMTPDTPYYTVWYHNGSVDLATPYKSWDGGESGTWWIRLWYGDGLPGGDWQLELYVAGQLVTSGEFTVEGPETIPQMADYISAERGLALRYPVAWEKVEVPGKNGYVAFFKPDSKSFFLVTTIQLSGQVVPPETNESFIARKQALLQEADPNVAFSDAEPFWLVGVEGQEFAYQYQNADGDLMSGDFVVATIEQGQVFIVYVEARTDEFDADVSYFNRMLNTLEVSSP
jgi:tetratricopeptide (TPR) repeat protein